MSLAINTDFEEVLEPFGKESANFFLAASLYHAHKLSFAAAAALSGLSFDEFAFRLREHFDTGFQLAESVLAKDVEVARELESA